MHLFLRAKSHCNELCLMQLLVQRTHISPAEDLRDGMGQTVWCGNPILVKSKQLWSFQP